MKAGVDAFWPDEGDWFNLFERIKRHQLYYEGPLSTQPNVRPWSLQRNGYPGIAQWGGWVWSGDTESSWKTLEAQIAVGLNYSLSIGPYWGSDIGGFYANSELTGELYARWFQFAAFCGSFRSHGRTWWTRLPWGWGRATWARASTTTPTRRFRPTTARNILPSCHEQPGDRADREEVRRAALSAAAVHVHARARGARRRTAADARAVAALSRRRARAREPATSTSGAAICSSRRSIAKGATQRDVYLPAGEWYDWWTSARTAGGRVVTRPVDLATMPIYVRAGAIVPVDPVRQYTSQPVTDADDAARLPGRRRPPPRSTTTTGSARTTSPARAAGSR